MAATTGIEAALERLKVLDDFKYSEIAAEFNVDRTALSKRHRGVHASRATKAENERLLTTTQEAVLIEYIAGLCRRGLPPTYDMVLNFAAEIAQKPPGKNWVPRFLERHQIKLYSSYASTIDRSRYQADSAWKYSLYFDLLRQKIEQYDIDTRHIYNMDEKGFMLGVLSRTRRIFTKAPFQARKKRVAIQDGNREWMTVLACICADGEALPPAVIYQAASGNIQSSWVEDLDDGKHKAYVASSPSGWTSNDLGVAWLKQVFDRHTKPKARQQWRLLILDGHGSHVSMAFIDYCDRNKILLAIFPPHSTHTLQPLDVVMFGLLAAAYSAELHLSQHQSLGSTRITKRDFLRLFLPAWNKVFVEKNVKKSFEATGIAPLDPQVILKKFDTIAATAPIPASSMAMVLRSSPLTVLEQLLKEFKADPGALDARRMSNEILALVATNTLLQQENIDLKEAISIEKKRRQRGKALLLEPPEEYHGGAVFWSPSKVQQARDAQQQKELDEAAAQHQKDEAVKARAEQKQLKQQLLEQRQVLRQQAKVEREAEAAEKLRAKQQKQEQKALEKQLKNDIQLSKKGKRQSLKPPRPSRAKGGSILDVVTQEEPSEAPVAFSRSGRQIKLPEKFK